MTFGGKVIRIYKIILFREGVSFLGSFQGNLLHSPKLRLESRLKNSILQEIPKIPFVGLRKRRYTILPFSASKRLGFIVKKLLLIVLLFCSILGVSSFLAHRILAAYTPVANSSHLKERIEFGVKWSFIPLMETYMEIFRLPGGEGSVSYLLTHQATMNPFWNDRMESLIDSVSFLPSQMQTIIKDGEKNRKETVIFDRALGEARFVREDGESGETIVDHIDISPRSMDPLSAFYSLRRRLSPDIPVIDLEGIIGLRRFRMHGNLVGEEKIQVPAGVFSTYRFDCGLQSWMQGSDGSKRSPGLENVKINPFTLWVTKDKYRFPVQIRYSLPLGSLWVRALTLESHDLPI